MLVPITGAIVTEALARIAGGELDGYFAENKARNALRSAAGLAWATFMSSPISTAYAVKSLVNGVLDTPIGRAQTLQCAAIDWIEDARYDRKRTALCNVARIEAAHAALRAVIAAWLSSATRPAPDDLAGSAVL